MMADAEMQDDGDDGRSKVKGRSRLIITAESEKRDERYVGQVWHQIRRWRHRVIETAILDM